jgi:hypothetical protein
MKPSINSTKQLRKKNDTNYSQSLPENGNKGKTSYSFYQPGNTQLPKQDKSYYKKEKLQTKFLMNIGRKVNISN